MAIVAGDWTIDRSTKKIAYTGNDHGGSPTYATVIQFHRWLQDLADDAVATASSGDELDITNTDPSRRSTDNIITLINGYTLDETAGTPASEHLYDGTIIQAAGDTIFDGFVNFGNPGVVIQVLQDGAVITDDWWNLAGGVGANADAGQGISHRWMIKVREDGVDIDGRRLIGTTRVMDTTTGVDHFTFGEFKINGTARGNNVFALTNADDLNNSTGQDVIAAWADFTNTPEGLNLIDINDNGTPEEYYSKWDTSGTHAQNDYYEYTKWLTRDGSASTVYGINGEAFRGITHNLAWSGDTGTQPVDKDLVVFGTNIVFTGGSGSFLEGEAITDAAGTPLWKGRIIAVDDNTGSGSLIVAIETGGVVTGAETFTTISGGAGTVSGTPTAVTGGGTFLCLAVDDDTGAGNLYVQVMKGIISPGAATLYNAQTDVETIDIANTLTQSGSAVERTISTPFIGVSTGSNIIGAYGIGFEVDQINDSDVLTAFDGNQYSRPNLVTNTVGGLTFAGDVDQVIVAPWNGSAKDINDDPVIRKEQMAINATYTSVDQGTILIGHANGDEATIPTDTPSAGTLRVLDDDGFERQLVYSSWTGSTFTIDNGASGINNDFDGGAGSGTYQATTGNLAYVTYLDESATAATATFQGTYNTDRDLVALVRNGGSAPIKQFIAEWTFKSTNQTLNAIRTTDL